MAQIVWTERARQDLKEIVDDIKLQFDYSPDERFKLVQRGELPIGASCLRP